MSTIPSLDFNTNPPALTENIVWIISPNEKRKTLSLKFLSYTYVHMHQLHAKVFPELCTAQTSYVLPVAMLNHSIGPSLMLAFTGCDKKA